LTTTAQCVTATKKVCHTKACQTHSKHVFLSEAARWGHPNVAGAGKLYPPLDVLVDQHFIQTSDLVIVSRYSISEIVSLSWL